MSGNTQCYAKVSRSVSFVSIGGLLSLNLSFSVGPTCRIWKKWQTQFITKISVTSVCQKSRRPKSTCQVIWTTAKKAKFEPTRGSASCVWWLWTFASACCIVLGYAPAKILRLFFSFAHSLSLPPRQNCCRNSECVGVSAVRCTSQYQRDFHHSLQFWNVCKCLGT